MKIVFVSNYYNHHQSAFSEAMVRLLGDGYAFISTTPVESERINMGWSATDRPPFVLLAYASSEDQEKCKKLILEADCVIWGDAPRTYLKQRLAQKKLTFLYTERIFKSGFQYKKWPMTFLRHFYIFGRHSNLYLLCASAYTATDFAKLLLFKNKAFKWGYFPQVKHFSDIHVVLQPKASCSITWAARFIDWKHPELPILAAKQLKDSGYTFSMNLIGTGALEASMKSLVSDLALQDCVHFLGAMSPDNVRKHMENSEIFLCTSDFNEGWGAVVNEAMSSGCAVVASHAMGSVPYLIHHNNNGFIFESENLSDLVRNLRYLLDHSEQRAAIGAAAYATIRDTWNANIAAERLIALTQSLLENKRTSPYTTGPRSTAQLLNNNWYHGV